MCNFMDNIQKPYLYEMGYIQDIEDFKQKVLNKAFIPHQVELQPGPKGRKICWLECEYCYGKSAINTDERLSLSRYL